MKDMLKNRNIGRCLKEKGMKYVEALVTGEGYFFDPQKMTRKQKEQAEKWLIEDEILQAKIEKGLITEEEAKGKFHYKDYKLKNKEYLIKEKRREENDLNKRIYHLQFYEEFLTFVQLFEQLSTSPEEKSEVDTFNASLASLISSGGLFSKKLCTIQDISVTNY